MAVGMALLLALSVVAPTVAAAETTVTVQTDPATGVTDQSATLNGNLTELSGADNATVYFEYWVEGDRANSTNTSDMTVGETGAFSWSATGLSNNTTYVYVAHAEANGSNVTGDQVTFTPGVTDSDEEDGPFGQRVAAFVHDLLDSGDYDGNIGQAVSEFVTENNPGADNRPDDAGPPEDRGDDEAGDEQSPPEDAGPPEDRDDDEDDEESDS